MKALTAFLYFVKALIGPQHIPYTAFLCFVKALIPSIYSTIAVQKDRLWVFTGVDCQQCALHSRRLVRMCVNHQ